MSSRILAVLAVVLVASAAANATVSVGTISQAVVAKTDTATIGSNATAYLLPGLHVVNNAAVFYAGDYFYQGNGGGAVKGPLAAQASGGPTVQYPVSNSTNSFGLGNTLGGGSDLAFKMMATNTPKIVHIIYYGIMPNVDTGYGQPQEVLGINYQTNTTQTTGYAAPGALITSTTAAKWTLPYLYVGGQPTGTPAFHEYDFTISSDQVAGESIQVSLYPGTASNQAQVGIVAAWTTPVPEPATMVLLALGGIGALIRRRS